MIITLSGPAASGKGTLARMLARHLGLPHYDFGLIFRAITFSNFQIQFIKIENEKIFFKGLDITELLKTEEVGLFTAKVASFLKDYAILFVKHKCFVCDGRTCGTEIYSNADFKFHIIANQNERIKRRLQDGNDREVMLEREKIDEARLEIPAGAIIIDTTGKTKEVSFIEIISYL